MFRKGIAAVGCMAVMAAGWSYAATTWQLQTKLATAGGQIQVRDKALQTAAGSIVYSNFTTSALIPVTVTPKPGYKITSVKKGTIAQTVADNQLFTINMDKTGGSPQSLIASFAADQLVVSGAVVGAGTITPASATVAYNGTVVFSSNPSTGSSILTSVTGATSIKDQYGNAVTLPTTKPVKITVANVTAAKTVTATYATVSVSAGSDKVVGLNQTATLRGSVSGGGTIAWSFVSGPVENVVLANSTTTQPSFTPAVLGTYVFQARESLRGNTDIVEVVATNDVVSYMRNACNGCHNQTSGVDPSAAFGNWSSSVHKTSNISCVSCHTDGAMPTPVNTKSVDPVTFKVLNSSAGTVGANYCVKCHRTTLNDHANSGAKCATCHNVHKPDQLAITALADNYVGSESCGACHADKYSTFMRSGHNFKVNKVVNNAIPVYPFSNISGALENMLATTTLNTLGKPASYADVTYVIGGYAWKARWVDKSGYLVTGSGVQYNLAYPATNQVLNQGWSPYTTTVNKKYTCGECHTTGWKYYAGTDVAQKQDGLAGMPGTWVQAGVQCEACHGPGKDHALAPAATNITKVAAGRTQAQMQVATGYGNPVTCGECHTRDGERNPYGGEGAATDGTFRSAYNVASGTNDIIGGRIRASALNSPIGGHHQTGDEMAGIDPDNLAAGPMGKHRKAGMSCGTCHDPHKTTFYQNVSGDGLGVDVACTSCHDVTFTATGAAHSNADCIKCHMPKLAKSAVNTGPNAAGKTLGDIRTHVFKIDLSAATNVAVADGGKFLKPFITKDYACGECHATPDTKVGSLNTNFGGKIHAKVTYKHEGAAVSSTITPPTTGNTCGTCHGVKPAAPAYVGASNCASCHNDVHAKWSQSWHTLKAKKGPALLGGSTENISQWSLDNWSTLKTYQILGKGYENTAKNYIEMYVSQNKKPVSDVAVVIGQARKQRYAVYYDGSAQTAKVVYSNNGGITYREKLDAQGNWVEVAMPAQPDRAGYMFLWLEVQLDQSPTPKTNSHNYEEWRSWQERCIGCHTTGFDRVAYNTQMESYKAAFIANNNEPPAGMDMRNLFISEWEVSCEACHGPGEGHKVVSPAKLDKNIPFEKETRRMVCESCHTRTNKNLQSDFPTVAKTANDRRGFILGDAVNGLYSTWMDYTSPAWGTGNRQVSIDGKGRRDHQMTMDIQLSNYLHTVVQGKSGSFHGNQNCFDCHKSHDVGLNGSINQFALNKVNAATSYNMYNLKTSNPADTATPRPVEYRLKDTREALCKSCHVENTVPAGVVLPEGVTVPQYASVQALLNVFNSDGSTSGYGYPFDAALASYDAANPTALLLNPASNWGGQLTGGTGAYNARGGRKSHVFNTWNDAANTTPNKSFGLQPEEYTWEITTAKVGLLNTTTADYKPIWPWLAPASGKTKVYGPLTNLGTKPPLATRPYQP